MLVVIVLAIVYILQQQQQQKWESDNKGWTWSNKNFKFTSSFVSYPFYLHCLPNKGESLVSSNFICKSINSFWRVNGTVWHLIIFKFTLKVSFPVLSCRSINYGDPKDYNLNLNTGVQKKDDKSCTKYQKLIFYYLWNRNNIKISKDPGIWESATCKSNKYEKVVKS